MRCDEAAEFVSARCDGEVIPQTAAEHLETCALCHALLEEYMEMGAELRRTASLEIEQGISPRIWTKPQGTSSMISNLETQAAVLESGHEFDGFLGKAFEEKPIWTGLYESIRDVFFPVKLPPLELTSKPIPVPDRMAVKPNPWAIGISSSLNILILLALLFFGVKKIIEVTQKPSVTPIDISDMNL